MDTKNTTEIKSEELIGLRSHLKDYLSKLDYRNPEHRQLAIKAMELYIKRYITPAMRLPDTTINGVVGKDITGLALGVMFDSQRKDLNRPNEEEIKEVFRDFFGHEATSQLREDFWTAWLVREAVGCLMKLRNFLDEPLPPGKHKQIPALVLRQEINQLQQILKLPMTNVKYDIEILLESEKEALVQWSEETTVS